MAGSSISLATVLLLCLVAVALGTNECQRCHQPILAASTCKQPCTDDQGRLGVEQQVCGNLTAALQLAQSCVQQCDGHVTINLGPGSYQLAPTDPTRFVSTSNITITGDEGPDFTFVCCTGTSGFSFTACSDITIENVTFGGCGLLLNSSSINTTEYGKGGGGLSYLEFRAAVYFQGCESVRLQSVSVTNSPGMGVVLYNTVGENTFQECSFRSSGWTEEGGGGVAVEFTYCRPGDTECDVKPPNITNKDAQYLFSHCVFKGNRALPSSQSKNFTAYPHGFYHRSFGRGGGLSVTFKGNAVRNTIVLEHCQFRYNFALWGSGLHISLEDSSQNNAVLVSHGRFQENVPLTPLTCSNVTLHSNFTGGGGVRIVLVQYPGKDFSGNQPKVIGNTVHFNNTEFFLNEACWGGGVSVSASRELPDHLLPTNSMGFSNCTFERNQAAMAAAADLSVYHPDTEAGALIEPVFENCLFSKNKNNFAGQRSVIEARMGVVYVSKLPTMFVGETHFVENEGSALAVTRTGVHVANHSTLVFESNTGHHGGAITFIGNGWLTAHYCAHLVFRNNSAIQKGGAIYAVHFGEHDLMYQEDCFFRYFDTTAHPRTWEAYFTFDNNTVPGGEGCDIYTTSTLPCVWPSAGNSTELIKEVFHWNQTTWIYRNSCHVSVSTAPSSFNTNAYEFFHLSGFPGQSVSLPIVTYNDYAHPLSQAVFAVTVSPKHQHELMIDGVSSTYYTTGELSLSGLPNTTSFVTVQTLDPRVISTPLKVTLRYCPPGFVAVHSNVTKENRSLVVDCKCGSSKFFSCNKDNYSASVFTGICVSAEGNSIIAGRCPYYFPKYKSHSTVTLPQNASAVEERICGPFQRVGRLCGQCRPGYGPAVTSYTFTCEKCNDYQYKWLAYVAAELLPITIFFLVVAAFHISATSAPMNAFVFFSQVSAIPYFQNRYPWSFGLLLKEQYLQDLFLIPYSIWNLDFLKNVDPGFCLSPNVSTVHILALGYITALYPLLLIFACYVVIQLYDRFAFVKRLFSYPVACIHKARRVWEPKTSMINVFATFLLLSYCKLTFVSFSLLTPTAVHYEDGRSLSTQVLFYDPTMEFFEGQHLVFALIAIVVLATFVVAPPVFLMLYPLKAFQRCLGVCPFRTQAIHTFADAFQGCFRDRSSNSWDCRYFAAIYFLLRIVLFVIYITENQEYAHQYVIQQLLCTAMIMLFIVVRPYKQNFYNYLDATMFALLATLNILSFYNYYSLQLESKTSNAVFWINYILLFLPLLYIALYVMSQCLFRNKTCREHVKNVFLYRRSARSMYSPISVESSEADDDGGFGPKPGHSDSVPDRLVNPQNYLEKSANGSLGKSWCAEGSRDYGSMAEPMYAYTGTAPHSKSPSASKEGT